MSQDLKSQDFQGYLKPNVCIEPLINQWYAWSYLIPPATAARYLSQSHLPVMQSFVDAPEVHVAARDNPAMAGAALIHYDADRAPEIEELLTKTKTEQAPLLALSEAIATLEQMLADHPSGESLEPLYAQIPEPLKGYVELVYDAQNHPSIRLIEGLLYRSAYYNSANQRIALRLMENCDRRPFVLSTPRLEDDTSLQLTLPFSDRRLDQLLQTREKATSVQALATTLGIAEEKEQQFFEFFTPTLPSQPKPYNSDGVRIRYLGHACVLIETAAVTILCDPLLGYAQPPNNPDSLPRLTYTDLPPVIDYALITHNHQDHVMFETLLQLRHKIRHLVVPQGQKGSLLDPSLKLILQHIGFQQTQVIDELESIPIPGGTITSLPVLGEHGDLNIGTKTAYWIQVQGRSILCAADSNNLEPRLYNHIHHYLGGLDVLFLGMECDGAPYTWAYGALLNQPTAHKVAQTRRLDGSNAERAIALVENLKPQQVYVYAMGQEPWLTFITSIHYTPESRPIQESDRLVAYCQQHDIQSERLLGCHDIELPPHSTASQSPVPIPVTLGPVPVQKLTSEIRKSPRIGGLRGPEKPPTLSPTARSKPITELLLRLQELDIRLWLEGETLRCNAPKGALTPEFKEQLGSHKADLIALLKEQAPKEPTQQDWQQDIHLPNEIGPQYPVASKAKGEIKILLTGATGFLGAFLLAELLKQYPNSVQIYCLVRADSTAAGQRRLEATLQYYQLWQPEWRERLVPILGDLAQPNLGLSTETWADLATNIDTIYHNGAWVHHISPYSSLKTTNVLGTQTILRLACQECTKPVHFTSTLSVLPLTPLPGQTKIYEHDRLDRYPVPLGGYNRSKWVAEQLVAQARDRGLPVTIYRPGPISGHSQTGSFNENDFLYRLVQGYLQLGSAPQGELSLDLLPVDYASRIMVALSRQSSSLGKVFHLLHPKPASSNHLFEALDKAGYPLQRIPYDQWYEKLLAIAQSSDPQAKHHALYPLVSLFGARRQAATTATQPQQSQPEIPFDCQNTVSGLQALASRASPNELPADSLICPSLDQPLFQTYLNAMLHAGVFDSALSA